jgi:predicted nucleotidyltransferase
MSLQVSKRGDIISRETRSTISTRYRTVTHAINREFWNRQSKTQNSLYVGSYGRGTAINTSDLDILVELPQSEYNRYDYVKGNG